MLRGWSFYKGLGRASLAQLEGKRFVWASGAPEHESEQGGAPITCRGLYRNPRAFRPQGALAITSNFGPKETSLASSSTLSRRCIPAREYAQLVKSVGACSP